MKKRKIKTFEKRYILQLLVSIYGGNVNSLLKQIKEDQSRETFFWFACRHIAFEILSRDNVWYELSNKIDYLVQIVEDEIVKNLQKWLEKEMAITQNMDTIESLWSWLLERYINTLKNTTNNTYKMYTRLDIVEFQDDKSSLDDMSTMDKVILDSFHGYDKAEKIAILTKIWFDAWDDFDFDIGELDYLCLKYDAPPAHTFIDLTHKIAVNVQKNDDGSSQLTIDFEGL
jgi:hypothetical protein